MPQQTAFIFHGTGSNPEQHWFQWLKSELESRGFEVFVPDFPIGDEQSLENWLEVFEEYKGEVGEDTVMIGHSLGSTFILDLLDIYDFQIDAAFLVSGFVGPLGLKEFDPLNETFAERDFDWGKIRESCGGFYIFHSDNDPYVPLEKAEELEEKLNAELEVLEGGKHLNQDAGYEKFPRLLESIESAVNV